MNRFLRWGVLVFLLLGAAGLIWYKTRPKPVEITVQKVVRGTVEKTVANTKAGTVTACRRAKLSPNIGGQLLHLPVKRGDMVKAGDLLLEIWNEDILAQVKLAGREVLAAEAQAQATCQSAEGAQRTATRAKRLLGSHATSEEAADTADTQAKTLQAQCQAAKSTIQVSRARVELAEAQLSRTRLYAPFDGIIAQIEGELNEYVTPSPIGIPTPPAIDLIENSCFYVKAPIDEVDAAAIRVGMEARISLDAYKNRKFAGKVRRIAPYVLDVEKQARTVDIEAAFINTDDYTDLLAGYSADVEIVLSEKSSTLRIPTEAILDGKRVFVYSSDDSTLRETTITAGLSNWASTEVLTGLQEGQLVVINSDKPGLKDGLKATVTERKP